MFPNLPLYRIGIGKRYQFTMLANSLLCYYCLTETTIDIDENPQLELSKLIIFVNLTLVQGGLYHLLCLNS